MPNLNSTIDLDVKKFFRWWLRELDFLVPEKIRQLVNEKRGFIIVRPEGNQLALTYLLNKQAEPLAILERNASGIAQYKALRANDGRLAKANLILRLTAQEAIQKELALPVAVKENLSQVVAYELDRYTPFKAEQVYFAVKPLEGEHEPGQIRVMLVLTPRETLDALYEDIKAMDMSPLFVDYEATPNDLEQRYDGYNLLPESLRDKTANTPRLIYTALIAAIFLLLDAVLALPVLFEYQTVNALQEKIDAIEKDAKEVKALQLEIDAMIDETRLLIAEKNAAPPVIEMLNTLSALIKDNTWLSYIQYSDGHLQIQGESPAASALIGVLEDSELFANARFVSPVTQDKASGQERFQITVDVTPAVAAPPTQSNAAPAALAYTPSLAIGRRK
ncbi:PilN domain-containing protein [Methylobacter sp.]|uniref:PilN domain-containing protein n=1 Tax=Methylobacter sp. TaxID=2051955 RepID=UPI002489720B|nr:PilN domain-containing protein [Methylobacter sp.]MDI1276668.1 PilN domain-containing protein [Methylobacter sp.]MDI1357337.1 PilN domain-containing protein [Methylobacter sp.]